jgi:transcriptional regulator with XRE-family HTH domain
MDFKENLICLRKSRGWSQEELGHRLNVTRQTVSKWENGDTTPEMAKLVEMARLFEVSLDCLVASDGATAGGRAGSAGDFRAAAGVLGPGFEYKSRRSIMGVPLVHVSLKRSLKPARGIIAVGFLSMGVVSVGVVSIGVLSLGVLAMGLLALGSVAAGLLALGAIAFGGVALGGVALGWFAAGGYASGVYALGGYAAARDVAVGGWAEGTVAVGEYVRGIYEFPVEEHISEVDGSKVLEALDRAYPAMNRLVRQIFEGLFL